MSRTALSQPAKDVLRRAQAIAWQCQAEQLNSAHLLLAVLQHDDDPAAHAAIGGQIQTNVELLRTHLEHALGVPPDCPEIAELDGSVAPSPEVNEILARAKHQADLQGSAIQLQHLQLAISSVPYGPAACLLQALETAHQQEPLPAAHHQQPQPAETGTTAGHDKGTANLRRYCLELTELAAQGKLLPVIGRQREIQQVVESLGRMHKNNPILLGGAGVGKTAIVEGLAQRIAAGQVPDYLQGACIFALDVAGLLAGASMRGDLEQRMRSLLDELQRAPKAILFVDEIHVLVGAGAAGGAMDAAAMIKPLLARGAIRLIGATTADEYRRIERDRALERRFDRIWVEQPDRASTLAIVEGLVPRMESHHRLSIDQAAVRAAVDLSSRYVTDRLQPDKALDVIDQAAAACRAGGGTYLPDQDAAATAEQSVGEADVRRQIAARVGIPLELIGDDSQRLLQLESYLRKRVVGQDEALAAVAACIRRNRCGLSAPNRPWGSFLFLGPIGVGKTLVARTVAEFLFGRADAVTEIDMGEYTEPHSVARLIGSPPGYVGHDEGGQLTEKVRRRTYQVLLLDEMDKAHPAVQQLLLGVLEGGRLTDGTGREVDFSNTIIIMTANAAMHEPLGFGSQQTAGHLQLDQHFIPELLDRLDRIVQFRRLSTGDAHQIAGREIDKLAERLAERRISLRATEPVTARLADEFDADYGARPIRNLVQHTLADLAAEVLLEKEVAEGDTLEFDLSGGDIVVRVVTGQEAAEDSTEDRQGRKEISAAAAASIDSPPLDGEG